MREYYCLEEYENGEVINHYRTQDRNGVRTDYGIVQRYPCRLGTHWVTIVLCSGLSALGTQAAAYWAAIDSGLFHDPSSRNPIPLPDSVHPDSCLEALIRASGDSGAPIWRPCEIDLMELYVDHYRWSPEERGWDDIQRHVFEIRVRDGEPLEVRIDDQKARLHAGSQNFNLVTTLVLTAARSRDNSVAVQDLAQNRAIWDGKRLTSTKVKQRLHNLRSTLMDTLKVDNRITVEADIKVTEA